MGEKVYSIASLTKAIRANLLANNEKIRGEWFEGEISGWHPYPSGHCYFTLKDAAAQISAVLFSFHAAGCDEAFRQALAGGPAAVNGLKVQFQGELDLSMSRGQYSFKVFRLRMAGHGDRMAEFNALKAKLEAEGLNKLDHPELRRALPFLPRMIGIVTSEAGAVIHDMCDVLTRRFPNLHIILYPVKVQGEGAAESVAAGIEYFNRHRPDLVIVGRGGGSAEDLWCFNEELLVRAVAGCAAPVISAVGHESDFTLCDYVADLRAGTPSIAAERAVPVKDELVARLKDASERLARAPMRRVENWMQQLDYLSSRLAETPRSAIGDARHRLERAAVRLAPALREAVIRRQVRLERSAVRLESPVKAAMEKAAHRLERARAKLVLLDPANTMRRGYSITLDENGRVVQDAAAVKPGAVVKTRLARGELVSRVEAATAMENSN